MMVVTNIYIYIFTQIQFKHSNQCANITRLIDYVSYSIFTAYKYIIDHGKSLSVTEFLHFEYINSGNFC